MTKKEERQLRDHEVTIDFLVNRMIDGTGGTSSNAMLAEALVGYRVDETEYPRDFDDLARCFRTWLTAPIPLRAKTLWRLTQYTNHISEKHISLDGVRDRA